MKRIMLGLLFDGRSFFLSRNFRLQKLGDLNWLRTNLQIFQLASMVDEIVVFRIARSADIESFVQPFQGLAEEVFIPLTVGGGIRSLEDVDRLFRAGADRIMFSETLWTNPSLVKSVGDKYGKQSVVGVMNFTSSEGGEIAIRSAERTRLGLGSPSARDADTLGALVGELVLQSIDRDGTGHGYPLEDLEKFATLANLPLIASGGFGLPEHFAQALLDERLQAALTSNLLAFVGTGLQLARTQTIQSGVDLPEWETLPDR